MNTPPPCLQCGSGYSYEDGDRDVCPECAHEWQKDAPVESSEQVRVVRDANGIELHDGDTVTVIKDLKVKGSSLVVRSEPKSGTSAWSRATTTSTARSTASVRRA